MPTKIISTATAEHYKWGGTSGTDCDGWHLVSTPDLNVIEEVMPPGTAETRHFHRHSHQFFYVLSGELTLEVEHQDFVLHAGQGLEITPGQAHQASNRSAGETRILLTSQPPSQGDRFDA
ncbi:cupin domain-containing protein [Granulicella sp. dw_53]|uniref:cupin domain-containing protein n=1 Tax=Granulicella sp. dw_53 TaxID=2719792 RepID=UPI001BD2C6E2|nr:cupin domain-containing protein [Granulicella sp. dw_53]